MERRSDHDYVRYERFGREPNAGKLIPNVTDAARHVASVSMFDENIAQYQPGKYAAVDSSAAGPTARNLLGLPMAEQISYLSIVPKGMDLVTSMIPRMDVAITIYFGQTSATVTGHPGSRTTSYILAGNTTTETDFTGAVTTDHWYTINAIDVLAPSTADCAAILGNSITDGRGSTTNMQNRWPDLFSEALLRDSSTQQVGVLNQGIGGNCVLSGGLGPTGVSRFDRDILKQSGVRWAIVFEGVNDIGGVRCCINDDCQ